MDLSIIIPSFNTKKLLQECLDSIKKNKGKIKVEVVVADNHSTDSTVDYLKKVKEREIETIFLDQNKGFAVAANQGIKKAKGKFILLLNADTQMLKGTLGKAIRFAKKHPQAIIGLQLINPDNSVQPSVFNFPSLIGAIKEFWLGKQGSYQKYAPATKKPIEVDAVTGAAMLISKKIIEEIGLLDEKYFFYFEDLDYCRRAHQKGFEVFYLPTAKVLHHHGAAGKTMPEQTHQWLVESSKKYNGRLKYSLLTLIIKTGQKWRQLIGKN